MSSKRKKKQKNKKNKKNSSIEQPQINIPKEIQKALDLHRAGKIAEARSIYEWILEVERPDRENGNFPR